MGSNHLLNTREAVELGKIMQERYSASKLNDSAFADSINGSDERKKFRSNITVTNVGSMRKALGIEANQPRVRAVRNEDYAVFLTDRVAALEQQVEKLAKTVMHISAKIEL